MHRILADIVEATHLGIARIKQGLQKTTPRERVLIAVLVLGASLYAPVHALEKLNQGSEAYVDALGDQASVRLAAEAARRVQAQAVSQVAIEDMESWGIKAANAPIAQLIIERKLVEAAEKAGVTDPVITTHAGVKSEGLIHFIHADVETELLWNPAFALIEALGEWPEGFRVTGFRYEISPAVISSRNRDAPMQDRGKIYFSLAFPVVLEEMPESTPARPTAQSGAR